MKDFGAARASELAARAACAMATLIRAAVNRDGVEKKTSVTMPARPQEEDECEQEKGYAQGHDPLIPSSPHPLIPSQLHGLIPSPRPPALPQRERECDRY